MATVLDALIQSGKALPMGVKPPKVTMFDALAKSLNDTFNNAEDAKRKQEEQKNRIEMYKTLRQAGYTSSEAYDAIEQGKLIKGAGNAETLETAKTQAEIDLAKARTADINKPDPMADLDIEEKKATIDKIKAETEKIKTGKGTASADDQFRTDFQSGIQDIRSGKKTLQEVKADLTERYPDKISTLKTGKLWSTVNKKKEKFEAKLGAGYDASKTAKVGNAVKTDADLDELEAQRAEYEAAGVDVDYILKLYGR